MGAVRFNTAAPDAAPMSLAELQGAKLKELSARCADQIVAGYVSSALGPPYTYPSDSNSQTNMIASVTRSQMDGLPPDWTTPFWCTPVGSDNWQMRDHSPAQIQQAGSDGFAAIVAAQRKNASLGIQVMDPSATLESVAAIAW